MRVLLLFFMLVFAFQTTKANMITGNVEKSGVNGQNQLTDAKTNFPIDNAKVSIPAKRYSTYTNTEGLFDVPKSIDNAAILKVEKEGYKPYSLTLNQTALSNPMQLTIEKSTPTDIILETSMVHLGDNTYSETSANSTDFQAKALGPFMSNQFKIKSLKNNENAYLVIGSIIGIDTVMARNLGQSKVKTAYASPPQIYFNGQKIAEIKVNGDRQEVKLPRQLIKENQDNNVTIKTGKNLFQTSYIDYDDIEFTNLYLEFR